MAFKYQRRSAEDVEKRASQQGDSFKGFIKDEYKFWLPKKGDNWIRILPPTWNKATHYGLDVHVHSYIGPERASVLCNLKMHGARCAVCEARVRLEGSGAPDEEIGQLKPSKRVVVYMLDMKDESKGVQIWAMPWTVDRDINKICKDKRDGTTYLIDDPEDGYDVFFDREGDGIGTKYTGFQLSRRPSSVDERHLDYISDHPLPDTMIERDYAEVANIYTGGMSEDDTNGRPSQRHSRDDDRPARRPARDEDEAPARRSSRDEDETPRSRRRDEEDERPARQREEDDPPRRRAAREEEVEDRPRGRPRDAVDDDEIVPLRRETSRENGEDRNPPPRRRAEPEDDRDPPPRRRASLPDDEDPPFEKDRTETSAGKSRAESLRERLAASRGDRR